MDVFNYLDKVRYKISNRKDNRENPSFAELLSKGTSVTLSEKSRLSFAPDIDRLWISKDKDGIELYKMKL